MNLSAAPAERPRPLGRRWAWALLAAAIALICVGLLVPPQPVKRSGPAEVTDILLYQNIIRDLRDGQTYYAAAVQEQRRLGYPLQPFVTVRLPTLAVALSWLPDEPARRIALAALAILTWLACARRAVRELQRPIPAIVAVLCGLSLAALPPGTVLHEMWAGLLIALSLALHDSKRWGPSLVAGLLAVSLRELAAPYLLVMAVLAWRDGHRAESTAWLAAIVAFAIGLWLHAAALAPLVHADDAHSPGWLVLGGWPFVLQSLKMNAVLLLAPNWVVAVLAPLALLGLIAWRGPLSDRLILTVLGYGAAFLIVGRPNNQYWGLLIAPLWPVGLAGVWTLVGGLRYPARRATI